MYTGAMNTTKTLKQHSNEAAKQALIWNEDARPEAVRRAIASAEADRIAAIRAGDLVAEARAIGRKKGLGLCIGIAA